METTICSKCQTPLEESDVFCGNCGYPERGTQQDINKYNYSIKLKKDVINESNKKLKNVKVLLYVLAGFNILFGLYMLFGPESIADAIANFIAAGVFIGCVIWVNNNALTGILAAFIFWILLQLAAILVTPASLFSGIIFKVIFIGIFLKGIASARDVKNYSTQLAEMHEH